MPGNEFCGNTSHFSVAMSRRNITGFCGSSPKATGMYLGRITEASEHFEQRYQLCVRQGPHRRGIKTYLIHATNPEPQPTLL